MKWLVILISIINALPVFSQSVFQEGDKCFDAGDYACAQLHYKETMSHIGGKDKQIAEIKLSQAKWCAENIKIANEAFDKKLYSKAKEGYQKILDTNKNDPHAKSQLEKCDVALRPAITLTISTDKISFTNAGGSERVSIHTNAADFSVDRLPSWCSVQKYMSHIIIFCDVNSGTDERSDYLTIKSGEKSVALNIRQSGKPLKVETTLTVSKENLSFSALGGVSEQIAVHSNAASYSTSLVPSWCSIKNYNGYFVVSCDPNTKTQSRSGWFKVIAGNKDVRIYLSQSGSSQRQGTTLSVSSDRLTFTASGGTSDQIKIYTNATTYSVALIPGWCSVQSYNGYFTVYCEANSGALPRSSWFKVVTADKEIKVFIKQEGASRNQQGAVDWQQERSENTPRARNTAQCFNCPKSRDTWGLMAGYSQFVYGSTSSLDGVQAGIRIEPLFKWGFGLITGIMWEGYSTDLLSAMNDGGIEQYSVVIPLHLEYRLNISKAFSLFTYGGPSFRYFNDSAVYGYTLPTTLDYGGGVRIGHIQFNAGRSFHVGDLKKISSLGKEINLYQNFLVSVSYMF